MVGGCLTLDSAALPLLSVSIGPIPSVVRTMVVGFNQRNFTPEIRRSNARSKHFNLFCSNEVSLLTRRLNGNTRCALNVMNISRGSQRYAFVSFSFCRCHAFHRSILYELFKSSKWAHTFADQAYTYQFTRTYLTLMRASWKRIVVQFSFDSNRFAGLLLLVDEKFLLHWSMFIKFIGVVEYLTNRTLKCPREKLARAQEYSSINVRNQRVRCDCGSCEEKCYREVRSFDETKLANINPTGILRFSNFPETFFVLLFIIYIWLVYKCLKNLLYFIINWLSNFQINTINGDKLPHKNDVLLIILIRQIIFDSVNFFRNTKLRSM